LAERLSLRENLGDLAPSADTPWYGAVEALGPGWAGQTLLARAGGYARHRNYLSAQFDPYTMEPLIATPPFVRALEELVAASQLGPAEAVRYRPSDVRHELLAGHCAMAITWPSHAEGDRATVEPETHESLPIGVAELPPSSEVYEPGDAEWQKREDSEAGRVTLLGIAGRLGSVTKSSRRPQAALDLLLRLSGTDWSTAISPQSPATTLYRTSQMQSAGSWIDEDFEPTVARDYAEVARKAMSKDPETHQHPLWLCSLRIPGRARYMAALDEAVLQAIQGDRTAAECLDAVAERWRKITAELGVKSQQAAYWRSLGMEP
jgi:multiple sugar transport system substrate-binding protein